MKFYRLIMMSMLVFFVLAVGAVISLKANNAVAESHVASDTTETDQQLSHITKRHNLTGNPARAQDIPQIASPKAQLGMKLFFSKALSGNLDVACASCHHPVLGGGDNLSLPIGVNSLDDNMIGQNRQRRDSSMAFVPRNAPTTFNIALWNKVMFHDGRIEQRWDGSITTPDVTYPQADPLAGENLVQAQARFPVTATDEMRGHSFDKNGSTQSCREALAARLGGYSEDKTQLQTAFSGYWLDKLRHNLNENKADSIELLENKSVSQSLKNLGQAQVESLATETQQFWLEQFRTALEQPGGSAEQLITENNISVALSEYQRSQVFIDNPWKAYIEGDKQALSQQAKQGALLFYKPVSNGGFDCVSCHSGDFFTDENFHHTLMPPIGPGKADHSGTLRVNHDPGRSLATGNIEDNYKFRTPSLLNVEVTGPWGHNGAYTTLTNVVRHMLNPYRMALNYNRLQLKQKTIPLTALQANIDKMLTQDIDLKAQEYTENDVQALTAFLKSLTDPCVKNESCLSAWLPKEKDDDPMRLQLKAHQ